MPVTTPYVGQFGSGIQRRVSSAGAALYTRVMGNLQKAAEQLAVGDIASASEGIRFGEVMKMISEAAKSNPG